MQGRSSLTLTAGSSASATGNPRNKTALQPGHSLMDWIRLGNSGQDLTGVGGERLEVTVAELAQHNKQDDAWIAIKGQVYNVTRYMDFHPGGIEELMMGVGKDGTELFDEVHAWVNVDSMLHKCYIGKLVVPVTPARRTSTLSKTSSQKSNGFVVPSAPPPGLSVCCSAAPCTETTITVPTPPPQEKSFAVPSAPTAETTTSPVPFKAYSPTVQKPRHDWFQSASTVSLSIFTGLKDDVRPEDVVVSCIGKHLIVKFLRLPEDKIYTVDYDLEAEITTQYKVSVSKPTGKVTVVLTKTADKHWTKIGTPGPNNDTMVKTADTEMEFHRCTIADIGIVSADTRVYKVQLPQTHWMVVPLGYHIRVKGMVGGVEVVRAYTPVPPTMFEQTASEKVEQGHMVHLMVKLYPDGALTQTVFTPLKKGDHIEMTKLYVVGKFVESNLCSVSHLVLLAAGTGFTPVAGLLRHTLVLHPADHYKEVLLLFFNKTEQDILWREQLEQLAATYDKLTVKYILSAASSDWTGLTGRVRHEMLDELLPKPGPDNKILLCVCGPKPFSNHTMTLSEKFGYTEDMTFSF